MLYNLSPTEGVLRWGKKRDAYDISHYGHGSKISRHRHTRISVFITNASLYNGDINIDRHRAIKFTYQEREWTFEDGWQTQIPYCEGTILGCVTTKSDINYQSAYEECYIITKVLTFALAQSVSIIKGYCSDSDGKSIKEYYYSPALHPCLPSGFSPIDNFRAD